MDDGDQSPPDMDALDLAEPDRGLLDAGDPEQALPDMDAPDQAPPDMAVPEGPCPGDMVLVPAGVFPYGPNNVPTDVDAFCIHRLEVTAGAFNACADAGGCAGYDQWARCQQGHPERPNQCHAERLGWPANWIDWFRAEEYCRWIGGRLPSEVEWEKAARGAAGRPFPHGVELTCADAHFGRGPVFNMCSGFGGRPDTLMPPGSYPQALTTSGALDMAGNVEEWVDIREDPAQVPGDDEYGVTRGGAYTEAPEALVSWARDNLLGHGRSTAGHGFRCVMAARPE
ncbi:MAG: SUMF1/EgtB/PvdO family nonheme iron enzyme [Myxococcales bacterium]|nr:SUMF1/EgtB/PvdO family nonheme iron enzyme [Myxococcales bacterium]